MEIKIGKQAANITYIDLEDGTHILVDDTTITIYAKSMEIKIIYPEI